MKYQAKLFLAPLFLILLVTIYQKFNNEKFYFVHSYCVKDVEEKYIAGKTYADKNSYIS